MSFHCENSHFCPASVVVGVFFAIHHSVILKTSCLWFEGLKHRLRLNMNWNRSFSKPIISLNNNSFRLTVAMCSSCRWLFPFIHDTEAVSAEYKKISLCWLVFVWCLMNFLVSISHSDPWCIICVRNFDNALHCIDFCCHSKAKLGPPFETTDP